MREKLFNAISALIGSALLIGAGYAFMRCMGALVLWLGI